MKINIVKKMLPEIITEQKQIQLTETEKQLIREDNMNIDEFFSDEELEELEDVYDD